MKRALAFLAALTMLAAAGCSDAKNDKSGKNGKQDSKASAASSQEDASQSSASAGDGAAITDGMINDTNCLIYGGDVEDDNDPYDRAVLYKMAELAVKQYGAVVQKDRQTYFDTMNIEGILSDEGAVRLYEALDGEIENVGECELGVYYYAMMAIRDIKGTEVEKLQEILADGGAEKCRETVAGLVKDLKPDDVPSLFEEYSPFHVVYGDNASEYVPEEFTKDPSAFDFKPDDSTIFGIDISQYISSDYGDFATINVVVSHGDWQYAFDECMVWMTEDQSSMFIGDIRISDNEVKGMTIDEIREKQYEEAAGATAAE